MEWNVAKPLSELSTPLRAFASWGVGSGIQVMGQKDVLPTFQPRQKVGENFN